MPKKGFKSITIKVTVFAKLAELAKKLDKSIPEVVKLTVETYQSIEEIPKGTQEIDKEAQS